jgi:hypothetical protein
MSVAVAIEENPADDREHLMHGLRMKSLEFGSVIRDLEILWLMIRYLDGIEPIISNYQLSSGNGRDLYSPFMQGWELYGNVRDEWRKFDSHSGTCALKMTNCTNL